MTQQRLLQQAAAQLFYQETCLVFVIGAVGNGMQISPLSVSAIIYSFIVNEKSEWAWNQSKQTAAECGAAVAVSVKSSECGTFGVDK